MSNAFLVSLFEHKAWYGGGFIDRPCARRRTVWIAGRWPSSCLTLEHTSIVDRIFEAHLSEALKPDFPGVVGNVRPVLDELAETMERTDAWYLDYVRDVSPVELETVVAFDYVGDEDQGRMSKGQMLASITHGAAHRGQINKLLEGLNMRGAPDMVTTYVPRVGDLILP